VLEEEGETICGCKKYTMRFMEMVGQIVRSDKVDYA
jgi:hypothetical protein